MKSPSETHSARDVFSLTKDLIKSIKTSDKPQEEKDALMAELIKALKDAIYDGVMHE